MSLSEWLQTKRTVYKNALTSAKARLDASDGSTAAAAYQAILDDGDQYDTTGDGSVDATIASLIPPANNSKFAGNSPNADEHEILALEAWLDAHPTEAGNLGLKAAYQNTSALGRKDLGTGGTLTDNISATTERRKWQGKAQYTFGGGILVGKDDKIVAALGTGGLDNADRIAGYGTDTLNFFDGVAGSKGSTQPGTTVFAGDVVVSGSIQGNEGVVIIDDVIQLEQGVTNPAGIGVTPDGKIHLRHRGDGFLDLIAEDERRQIEDKRFVTGQNTSSQRYGTSLIPNSGFAYLESTTTGEYAEQVASIATFGQATSQLAIGDNTVLGIGQLDYTGGFVGGIIFQAIPITSERYSIRIRFKGDPAENLDDNAASEGLFLEFHETNQEDLHGSTSGRFYIKADTGTTQSTSSSTGSDKTSELFLAGDLTGSNTITVKTPNLSAANDSGNNLDGISIPNSYEVKSFVYQPTAGTKNASLVVFAKNYVGTIDIDYIVMTEQPPTSQEIQDLANSAASDILVESDNDITDAQMSSTSNWLALNSTITDSLDGNTNGDEAIEVLTNIGTTASNTGPSYGRNGILSSRTSCDADEYIVGVRLKAIDDADPVRNTNSTVTIFVVEDNTRATSPFAVGLGPISAQPDAAGNASDNIYEKTINTVVVDNGGNIISGGASSHTITSTQVVNSPNLAGQSPAQITLTINSDIDVDPDGTVDEDGDGNTSNDFQNGYVNLIGTYKPTVRSFDSEGTRIQEVNGNNDLALAAGGLTDVASQSTSKEFSIGVKFGTTGSQQKFLIDYFYVKPQSTSLDIASSLADQAYGDAEGFVTATNEALIRESGSIMSNANMAFLDSSGLPVGYYPYTDSVITPLLLNADRQLSVTASSGSRRIVSPTFQLGSADKFSIGVRIKSASGTARIRVKVAWLHGDQGDSGQLETGFETLAYQTSGYTSPPVFQSNSSVSHEYLGDTTYTNVTSSDFTSLLYTWDRTPIASDNTQNVGTSNSAHNAKVAALEIETYAGGHQDFIIDYILVKEQTCSFDLADASAQLRRDEAIAQIGQRLDSINNAMNQETGSLLANSTFAAFDYNGAITPGLADNGDGLQIPKNWALTRTAKSDGSSFFRAVSTTDTTQGPSGDNIHVPGEVLRASDGFLGGGAIVRHHGTSTIGLLASYYTLPIGGSTSEVSAGGQTVEPTGRYLVAMQLRSIHTSAYSGASEYSGLRILAHETYDAPVDNSGNNVAFALCTSSSESAYASGTTVASSVATGTGWGATAVKTFTEGNSATTSETKKIQLINLSDSSDTIVGFDAGGTPSDTSDDDVFIERWQDSNWHTIGGTYTPSAGMRYVCFEFIFETNDSGAVYAIDYVTLTPQSIDADFADTLAQARTEGAIDNLQDEPQVPGNLIVNPFFSSANLTSTTDTFPHSWLSSGPSHIGGTDRAIYTQSARFEYIDSTNKVGLKVKPQNIDLDGDGNDDAGIGGVISKAFKPTAGDYLVKVRLRTMSGDSNNSFKVYALECNSELTGTQAFVRHTDANTTAVNQAKGPAYSTLTEIGTITDTSDSSMTTHTFEYDPAFTTDSDNNITITPKWTSIGVFPESNTDPDKGYQIEFITCTIDPTATGNRLFGDYQNISGAAMMQNQTGNRSHINQVWYNTGAGGNDGSNTYEKPAGPFEVLYNASGILSVPTVAQALGLFAAGPTAPERPIYELKDAAIAKGHSLTLKQFRLDNNLDWYEFNETNPYGSSTVHYDNSQLTNPAKLLDSVMEANVYNGIITAGEPRYYNTSSGAKKGVSFYAPKASHHFGIRGGVLWCKGDSDTNAGIRFYDRDSTNYYHIYNNQNNQLKIMAGSSNTAMTIYNDGDVAIPDIAGTTTFQSTVNINGTLNHTDGDHLNVANNASNSGMDDGDVKLGTGYGVRYFVNDNLNSDYAWLTFAYWHKTNPAVGSGELRSRLAFYYGGGGDPSAGIKGYVNHNGSGAVNFTGQHRCEDFEDSLSETEIGLIVVSTGRYNNLAEQDRPTINESLPIVALSSKRNQKSCFGVLSNKEDRNGKPREYEFGNFVSVHDDQEILDRLIINSLGEGAIWVCNINGDLENGDYITTCEVPGYGMLQDDDLLHNYTVAKITQDCNFELDNPYYDCVEFEFEGNTYRKAFVGCTYHCG